jgi:hypothetical protein
MDVMIHRLLGRYKQNYASSPPLGPFTQHEFSAAAALEREAPNNSMQVPVYLEF